MCLFESTENLQFAHLISFQSNYLIATITACLVMLLFYITPTGLLLICYFNSFEIFDRNKSK